IKSLFKVPEAPKIGINDLEFESLTEAEKLNDSQYRRLIYQLYPNERTCGCCSPTNAERYGGWCNSQRKKRKGLNNGNDDKVLHFMSRYCVENQPSNELYNGTYCSEERIRGGGGSTREEDPGKPTRGVEELKNSEWRGLALNECPKNSTYPMRYDDIAASNQIQTYYLSSRFKSTCPGSSDERNILNSRKSTKHSDTCRRKKCPHIDCLTRAFEEAQEFVDSLGKVPGLPGLGLMDPSASPYYRAPRDFKRIRDELPDEGNPCTSASTSPWTKATPFTIAVPGRNGIVREAAVSDDDNYNYKYNYSRYNYGDKDKYNDELNTADAIGPCGERQCKARRKKVHRETVVTEGVETPVEYVDEPKKKSYLMKARHQDRDRDKDRKYKFNRQKVYHAGPRGDGFRKSIKKPKKRKIRKRVNVGFVSRSHSERLYGHKNCNDRLRRVPAHMGWFWTEYQPTGRLKPRIGWRPGAISKQIREMIQAAKIGLIEKRNRPASVPSAMRIGKKLKTKSSTMLKKKQPRKFNFNAEDFKAPPTLYIQRRDGIYYFTMYPVKKESENTPVLDEPMKPVQFKIAPNRDDASGASSSVASDMDIEFSPPAALNRAKKKPDVVHVDTQVRQQDILDAFQPLVPEVRKVKSRKSKKKKKK
ncbi:GSCOCG00001642001-RA-CDS, partial [Cotesia congregata]